MIRPVQFRFNEETANDNAFQQNSTQSIAEQQQIAQQEFDTIVTTLENYGVSVKVISDVKESDTPDSIFPNNWMSTHQSGEMVLYPMLAENRRKEVRQDIVDLLAEEYDYDEILDWTTFTKVNQFLEGTGSLVLDRKNKVAYACISERTNLELAFNWGSVMGFEVIAFSAVDRKNKPIYHTNVMMNVGEHYTVICLECIANKEERNQVKKYLKFTEKEIIEISMQQMEQFAGNMLELSTPDGESLLVLSQSAYDSLSTEQIKTLKGYSTLVVAAIPTIEQHGGGSVRCMIAELF